MPFLSNLMPWPKQHQNYLKEGSLKLLCINSTVLSTHYAVNATLPEHWHVLDKGGDPPRECLSGSLAPQVVRFYLAPERNGMGGADFPSFLLPCKPPMNAHLPINSEEGPPKGCNRPGKHPATLASGQHTTLCRIKKLPLPLLRVNMRQFVRCIAWVKFLFMRKTTGGLADGHFR